MKNNNNGNKSFDSIDFEFGITTNNINAEETMTIQSQINMTSVAEVSFGDAEVSADIQSPVEVLANEQVANGWLPVSTEEQALLSKANQLGFGEVKTSPKAWELFTGVDLGIRLGSFGDKVQQLYSKGLANKTDLEAIYGKHCFDEGQSLEIIDGIFHGIHKQGHLIVEVAVDFNKGKICYVAKHNKYAELAIQPIVKDLRKFALISFLSSDQRSDRTGLYSVEDTVRIFWALVNRCWTMGQFNFLIASMISKLFVDHTEQQFRNKGRAYGVREAHIELDKMSREQIIEAHKISIIPVVCLPQKPGMIFQKSTKKGRLDGSEFQTCYNFFSQFNEPIIIDKQAKKWLAYGNGARASFVDYSDYGLVSANPTGETTKFLNRQSSHSFKQAYNQSVSFTTAQGETLTGNYSRSNLQIALKDNDTCYVEGVETPVFISLGDFAINAGTIETNVAQDVRFSYDLSKTLSKEISINEFRKDFILNEAGERLNNGQIELKVQEAVVAQLQELGNVVKPHGVVKVAGATVIRNDRHFAISTKNQIVKATDVGVILSGTTAKGQASTVNVSIKGYASMTDKRSPKLRSNLKKGSAFPTDTIIKHNGVAQDWTTILSPETLKGSAGMAELIANHDNYFGKASVVWNKGELLFDGVAMNVETVLKDLCGDYEIVRRFSKDVWQNPVFARVLDRARSNYAVVEDGDALVITETVRGFFSYANYCVEVSAADENAGYSSLGTNEQHFVALFNSVISSNLKTWSEANLAKAKYLSIDYNYCPEVIEYSNRKAIAKLAGMIHNESGSIHDMEKLAKAYPNGVKIEGAGFSQVIPFSALLHFGNWDGMFPGSSNQATPSFDEEKSLENETASRNICQEVFDVIRFLSREDLAVDNQEIRDAISRLNGLPAWLENQRSINAVKLVKVEETVGKKRRGKKFNYHLKVVGNPMLGFDNETKLPVVEIHPNNPSGFKNNSRILMSRCPLPLFTACVVRHNEALDSAVVAVNPMIWSASNAGDHDGDTAYLTNLYLLNGSTEVSVEECQAFNNNYSGLATHWDVFAESEGEAKPYSPLLNNLGEGKDQISKFADMGSRITSELAKAIPSVSKHYAMAVGEFHKVSTALTEAIGNKAFKTGVAPSKEEVIALHKSWVDYEEFGLSGWTQNNAEVLEKLKGTINAEMINPGSFKPRASLRGRSKAPSASTLNWIAIEAAAISEIGARVMRDEAGADDEAIIAQALKRIAKKDIANNENLLWIKVIKMVRDNPDALKSYRFGKHIEVLGKVRLLA